MGQSDEVKDIRDKARAIEMYARQAQNTEAERQAIEIRLRAERKCGEILTGREMAKGAAQPGVGRRGSDAMPSTDTRALGALGISHDQSSQWQKLAAIPQDDFEADIADPERVDKFISPPARPDDCDEAGHARSAWVGDRW